VIRKWIGAITILGVCGLIAVDFGLWCFGGHDVTISGQIQPFVGGSVESMRAAMLGAAFGGLLVHWTRWGAGGGG
jgi:hypothetical protein